MGVKSPITNSENCTLVKEIDTSEIIEIYRTQFNIDISRFFTNHDKISQYKCLDTGFEFFFPLNLEGDENYYQKMGKLPWYYCDNRWEHQKAISIIKDGTSLLEVGSGSGFFLQQLKSNKKVDIVGLELNLDAISTAKKNGLVIIPEYIQDYSSNNKEKFDVVCSFQVLEHVSDPFSFLRSSVDCLKKNGVLIIGVPNNDSFIKNNIMDSRVLNLPPHHVGLWSESSLKSLEKYLPLKFENTFFEPLVGGSVGPYLWNKLYILFKSKFLLRVIWKLQIHFVLIAMLKPFRNKIKGSSMLMTFRKI